MEKLTENQESPFNVLKKILDRSLGFARTTALISLLNLGALNANIAEAGETRAQTEENTNEKNIPKYLNELIKRYEADFGAIFTPQITTEKSKKIIIDLAQIHRGEPTVDLKKEEKEDVVKCQKNIEKFAKDILAESKKHGDQVIFFDEGLTYDFSDQTNILMSDELGYLLKLLDGNTTIEDIEKNIEEDFRKSSHHFTQDFLDKEKYVFLNFMKRLIEGTDNFKNDRKRELLKEVDERLTLVNLDNVYYVGGLAKMKDEFEINLYKTEDHQKLEAAVDLIINGKYESPELMKLKAELFPISEALEHETESLKIGELREKEKKILADIQREKDRILQTSLDAREDFTVDKILETIRQNRRPKSKGNTIVIVTYGAAHDLYNNVKSKTSDVILLRLNLVDQRGRELYGIKN